MLKSSDLILLEQQFWNVFNDDQHKNRLTLIEFLMSCCVLYKKLCGFIDLIFRQIQIVFLT